MKRIPGLLLVSFVISGITGCSGTKIVDIPPGYIGKVLTPTGWKEGIIEAGQVDIGEVDNAGRSNSLVNCEATTKTIEEHFAAAGDKNNSTSDDHRVITKTKTPLAVDVYVQVAVPDDPKIRDSIFAQITPSYDKEDNRVAWISLDQIYAKFAQMTIRGKTREIFSSYQDYDAVMADYEGINKKISAMIADTFQRSKIPLKLVSGQLSNVKADETVWAAENKKAAAKAEVYTINQIGKAISDNPGYLEKYKWDELEKIASKGVTIIVNDNAGTNKVGYNIQPNAPPSK